MAALRRCPHKLPNPSPSLRKSLMDDPKKKISAQVCELRKISLNSSILNNDVVVHTSPNYFKATVTPIGGNAHLDVLMMKKNCSQVCVKRNNNNDTNNRIESLLTNYNSENIVLLKSKSMSDSARPTLESLLVKIITMPIQNKYPWKYWSPANFEQPYSLGQNQLSVSEGLSS